MSSSIPDPVPDNATPEQLRHIINYWRIEANHANSVRWQLQSDNERLRKACELVFGEAAKRKFLRCYPGNDFYVSLQAMEEMKKALELNASNEGKDAK